MGKTRLEGGSTALFVSLVAILFAVVAFGFSVFSSFRLTELDLQSAWQLNFDRTALVFAAGFALTASLASKHLKLSLATHIEGYSLLVFFAAGGLLSLVFSLPLILSAFLALVSGVTGIAIMRCLMTYFPSNNLVLGLALYLVFFISTVSYLSAAVYADTFGGIVLWLFSGISTTGANGYWALLSVILLSSWLLLASRRELPALLLLGVSIGLLGPIMFIGYVVPAVVKWLRLNDRQTIVISGLVGGAALTLVFAVSALALGGYAPALIIPLGFIGIPCVLWLNRLPQNGSILSISETFLILAIMLISAGVVLHLSDYAQRLS